MQVIVKAILAAMLIVTALSCRQKAAPPGEAGSPLLERFAPAPAPDTLHAGIDLNADLSDSSDASLLPDTLVLSELDTSLLNRFLYDAPDEGTRFYARYRFPLDERFEACLLEAHQHWFRFKALLLFDRRAGRFTDVQPAAQFYGGEGGQVLDESWMFDWDGDGRRDMLTHNAQHSISISEEGDPVEHYDDSFRLLLWNGERFEAGRDSLDQAKLLKEFPVEW